MKYTIYRIYSILLYGLPFDSSAPERHIRIVLLPFADEIQTLVRSEIILKGTVIAHCSNRIIRINSNLSRQFVLNEVNWITFEIIQEYDFCRCLFYNFHFYLLFSGMSEKPTPQLILIFFALLLQHLDCFRVHLSDFNA